MTYSPKTSGREPWPMSRGETIVGVVGLLVLAVMVFGGLWVVNDKIARLLTGQGLPL